MPEQVRSAPRHWRRRHCGGGARAFMGSAIRSGLPLGRRRQWRHRLLRGRRGWIRAGSEQGPQLFSGGREHRTPTLAVSSFQ